MKRVILVCDVCGIESSDWVETKPRRVVFGEYESESRDVCPRCAIRLLDSVVGKLRHHDPQFVLTPIIEQMSVSLAEAQKTRGGVVCDPATEQADTQGRG